MFSIHSASPEKTKEEVPAREPKAEQRVAEVRHKASVVESEYSSICDEGNVKFRLLNRQNRNLKYERSYYLQYLLLEIKKSMEI